jgi:hypothetical protein
MRKTSSGSSSAIKSTSSGLLVLTGGGSGGCPGLFLACTRLNLAGPPGLAVVAIDPAWLAAAEKVRKRDGASEFPLTDSGDRTELW